MLYPDWPKTLRIESRFLKKSLFSWYLFRIFASPILWRCCLGIQFYVLPYEMYVFQVCIILYVVMIHDAELNVIDFDPCDYFLYVWERGSRDRISNYGFLEIGMLPPESWCLLSTWFSWIIARKIVITGSPITENVGLE